MIRDWNDSTIKRFLKEGRGQGEGSTYKPWLQVQDISSKGRSTRTYSYKSQRTIHLLSDLQLYYWYLLEFDQQVVDLREQYPLLNFHELNIQMDKGLEKKLFNAKTGVPHVFTISFMVKRIDLDKKPYYEARAIKMSSELEKKGTIERLELQRRYFEEKKINFGIVTEKEINKQLARNIGWVLTAYDLQDYPELMGNLEFLKIDMLSLLSSNTERTFQSAFSRLEKSYELEEGMGLILFKHLVATKQIIMDMSKKIELNKKIDIYNFRVPQKELSGENHAIGS